MKILIVDDEMLAREVLKTQLEALHYQNIKMATDGKSALLSLRDEIPDVIFLDICMPEMSGIEFMEQAANYKKDIVYVILSGYDIFEYAQRTMELGAYKYLLKPVDTQTLMNTMHSVETMIAKQSKEEERYADLNKRIMEVDLELSLLQSLYQEDSVEMNNRIKALYDLYLSEEYTDIKQLGKMHLSVFVLLHKELGKSDIESSTILEDEFLLYRKIQAMDTISDMQTFLLSKIQVCKEAIAGQGRTGHEKIMLRAKEYIKQNMGYNLTLESTAEYVNFSPTYFSRFFKNEAGMNFIEYVTKARIEEAKELLNRNVKTADICSKIGFRDIKHFYKIFKKIEGVTPGQYKRGLITK